MRSISPILSLIGAVLLAILLPSVCLVIDSHTKGFMVLGVVSWCVAVALKIATMKVRRIADYVGSGFFGAVIWGMYSAVTELGATAIAIALTWSPVTTIDCLAIGVGVASIEIVYVLAMAIRATNRKVESDDSSEDSPQISESFTVRYVLFVERVAASIGHIGSRALIALSMTGVGMVPAMVAFVSFSVVDGIAILGRTRRWNWLSPNVARPFYTFCICVGSIEIVLFLVLKN